MNNQLAKEAVVWKTTLARTSSRHEAHGSAMDQSTGFEHPLRTLSMPHVVKQPATSSPWPRSQSASANMQEYPRLQEDEAIINHRTVEDLRARKWEKAEQKITSAFFFVWAAGVVLLGGWHVASQLSANVAQVAVAVLAATCTPAAYFRARSKRQPLDGVPCVVG